MPVIDFRVRPPFRDFLGMVMYGQPERRDRFTRQLGFEPSRAATEQSVDLMLAEMDRAGIDIGVVIGRNSGLLGSVANETVLDFVGAHPGRFLAVASIDATNRKAASAAIDRAMADGFRAINIEPGACAIPMQPDDRRLYPIYARCEDERIPVIMMTGGNAGPDLSYSMPVALDRVLADFPSLKVASSHGGWPWVTEILHVAFRRPNLYLSPDMYLVNMPGMADYVAAANGFLADRFLYASSFPFCPIDSYAAWFRTLPIRPENMERIMYGNAAAFLGLTDEASA
ncbi:amidohydrolase family protein [uncultured Enterovirga sp.]|uniref:amidohydrolase family protein n=1 Tax=uncultured Enterovirga sp. TaxID=2026352 RepID=UPI0035C9F9F8